MLKVRVLSARQPGPVCNRLDGAIGAINCAQDTCGRTSEPYSVMQPSPRICSADPRIHRKSSLLGPAPDPHHRHLENQVYEWGSARARGVSVTGRSNGPERSPSMGRISPSHSAKASKYLARPLTPSTPTSTPLHTSPDDTYPYTWHNHTHSDHRRPTARPPPEPPFTAARATTLGTTSYTWCFLSPVHRHRLRPPPPRPKWCWPCRCCPPPRRCSLPQPHPGAGRTRAVNHLVGLSPIFLFALAAPVLAAAAAVLPSPAWPCRTCRCGRPPLWRSIPHSSRRPTCGSCWLPRRRPPTHLSMPDVPQLWAVASVLFPFLGSLPTVGQLAAATAVWLFPSAGQQRAVSPGHCVGSPTSPFR